MTAVLATTSAPVAVYQDKRQRTPMVEARTIRVQSEAVRCELSHLIIAPAAMNDQTHDHI
jgi:hypothetical protein